MKRTKPYAADATGRSTGEMVMTACVMSVLLMPMKMPAAMTQPTMSRWSVGSVAISARSMAKRVKAA